MDGLLILPPGMQAATTLYMQLGFCDSEDGACLVEPPTGPHRMTLMKELFTDEESSIDEAESS